MGAANADTANAAKLRLCLSALLNDLDMKKSPMGFENTLEIMFSGCLSCWQSQGSNNIFSVHP
jgi:hypothetical protein